MRRGLRSIWFLGLGLVAAYTGQSVGADDLAAKQNPPARLITFETDVSPIFRASCWRCHGEKTLQGKLDLRSLAGVMKGGESGPVIVLGKPDESLLFSKIHDGEMPPSKTERLVDADLKSIRLWIENGAKSSTPDPTATSLVNQHDVISVLLRHCTVCHGVRRKEGDLDLRTKASMLRGGKSGPAVDLAHPDDSLLLKKIRDGEMPPHK